MDFGNSLENGIIAFCITYVLVTLRSINQNLEAILNRINRDS